MFAFCRRLRRLASALKSTFLSRQRCHVNKGKQVSRYEEYVSGPAWDALDPQERFGSVGDVCAHLAEQLPLQLVKLIARDVLRELDLLHDAGLVHGNITRTTILLSPTDMKELISLYLDEEMSQSAEQSFRDRFFDLDTFWRSSNSVRVFRLGRRSSKRDILRHDPFTEIYAVRPPEAILDAPCDTSADLWTLGCVLYELLTGESLFDPFFQTVELGLAPEESHIIQIIEMLGDFPVELIASGKNSRRWFAQDGTLRLDTTYYPVTLEKMLKMHIDHLEVAETADFLGKLLCLLPRERGSARELSNHPWFS
ncbi:kinase-like domain-containing protein [Mycena floridula]|nr:kinase-like domain-containing protein [Mycena floridula]